MKRLNKIVFSRFTHLLLLLFPLFFYSCTRHYTVLNKGVAGNNTYDLLKRLEPDVLSVKPDLVILMAGTNDMVNSHKLVSYTDFTSNFQKLIRALQAQGIRVVVMSPPPVDTGYVFQRHDRQLFPQEPNVKIDSLNKIVQQLATAHQLHFIDINQLFKRQGEPHRGAHSLIVNASNLGKEDGIHPTREGYQYMAAAIYRHLKQYGLLKKTKTLVCFGDSMTYGAFMQGAGTATGETYPAFLHQMLHKK